MKYLLVVILGLLSACNDDHRPAIVYMDQVTTKCSDYTESFWTKDYKFLMKDCVEHLTSPKYKIGQTVMLKSNSKYSEEVIIITAAIYSFYDRDTEHKVYSTDSEYRKKFIKESEIRELE